MNIQAMMKQAQKLQKEMMETKKIIDETVFTGESSFVKVSVYGNKKIKEIMIEEKDLSSDDIEMLQDMIVVAINDAMNKIDKETEKKLFSPFFSTKPNGQGIGLVFIREVLTRHGCTFSLRTYSDGLTRFRIIFP